VELGVNCYVRTVLISTSLQHHITKPSPRWKSSLKPRVHILSVSTLPAHLRQRYHGGLKKSKERGESEETHMLRQRLTTTFQPKWTPNKTFGAQAVVRSCSLHADTPTRHGDVSSCQLKSVHMEGAAFAKNFSQWAIARVGRLFSRPVGYKYS
jgi:hypothetical protein